MSCLVVVAVVVFYVEEFGNYGGGYEGKEEEAV